MMSWIGTPAPKKRLNKNLRRMFREVRGTTQISINSRMEYHQQHQEERFTIITLIRESKLWKNISNLDGGQGCCFLYIMSRATAGKTQSAGVWNHPEASAFTCLGLDQDG
jgi:hypothetical protein